MRVLFLSTWFPYPPDNGSKQRVFHLLRALAKRHEVRLASFAFDTARPEAVDALRACTEIGVTPVDPFAANRAGALRTFLSPMPVVARPLPGMQRLVAEMVAANPPDVVIASTGVTAEYAVRLPGMRGRVLEDHNSMTRWMRERGSVGSRLGRMRAWAAWQKSRRYEAALFSRFDLVTMVSEADRRACYEQLPGLRGRIEVVPNGVDTQTLVPQQQERRLHSLVYNGALTYRANYDAMQWFLSDIYPLVKVAVPAVSLIITGSTKGVDLGRLRLDPSVILSGWVEDVGPLVAAATVCIAPIREGGGTRLKILEAMALGAPVIATTKGAEGLAVQHGESIMLADSAEDFARATIGLLTDLAQQRWLAVNARQLVEAQYDWSQIGDRFVALVEEAVEQPSVAPLSTLKPGNAETLR